MKSKKDRNLALAKAGDKLSAKAGANLRKQSDFWSRLLTEAVCTVAPKSDAKDGRWVCIDCGEMFQNNMYDLEQV